MSSTSTSKTRIDARFAKCAAEGRAALVTFVMCGDPDIATSLAIIKALPGAGADGLRSGSVAWGGGVVAGERPPTSLAKRGASGEVMRRP